MLVGVTDVIGAAIAADVDDDIGLALLAEAIAAELETA